MTAAFARTLSTMRESAFAWSVGLATLFAIAALAMSEIAAAPGWLQRTPELTFLQGILIGGLLVIVPLYLLIRRNAQLQEMQRELTLTVESSRTAFYTWNVRENRAKGWGKLRSSFGMPTESPEFVPDVWAGIIHPDDLKIFRAAFVDHFKGRTEKLVVDYRIKDKNGDYLWVRDKAVAMRREDGWVESVSGTIEEVTELKEAEMALRESEARATLALLASNSRIWQWDIEAGTAFRTRSCAEILGIGEEEVSGDAAWWLEQIHAEDVDAYKAAIRGHLKGETDRFEVEYRVRRRDGSYRRVLDRGLALRNESGRAYRMAGAMEDITERWLTEEALRQTQATLRAFLDNAPVDIAVKDRDGRYLLFNRRACERFGLAEADVVGKMPREFLPPRIAEAMISQDRETMAASGPIYHEMTYEMPDDTTVEMSHVRFPIHGEDGTFFGIGAFAQDVTEARAAERQIRDQKEQLREMADALPAQIVYLTRDLRIGFINRTAAQWWGVKREDVIGRELRNIRGAGRFDPFFRSIEKVFEGEPVVLETQMECADGKTRQVDRRYVPSRDANGNVIGVYGMSIDITETRAAERELSRQRERIQSMADALPAKIIYITRDHKIGFINRTAEQWWGCTKEDLVGRPISAVPSEEHYLSFLRHADRIFSGEAAAVEVEIACADGVTRRIDRRYVPHRDADGHVVGVYGMSIDVTEQHAVAERLRQSQKMEAVGNLTGGIAHDFNNMLLAVGGNLEFLEEELETAADGQSIRFVRNARKGISRAADLTARLLAFSRRQTLRPANVEIVSLFGEVRELLRRTLPENIDIRTEVSIEGGRVKIDSSQLESTLLNLAINARDAMPDGGGLTFRIGRVAVEAAAGPASPARAAGDYIRIQVQDTGCGMEPKVVEQAFEPFFTTKEIGQGTGLGLSMVLGFVEQSGGFVEIDSTVGQGTTVSLFLPVCTEDAAADSIRHLQPAAGTRLRGRVLLVEDDEMVREVAELYLADLGYTVTTANDGTQALARLDGGDRFDLIVSDVMMPNGLSGVGLAEAARVHDPDQPFLLMSGYADGNIPLSSGGAGDVPVLQKPFTKAILAAAVRDALKSGVSGQRRAASAA